MKGLLLLGRLEGSRIIQIVSVFNCRFFGAEFSLGDGAHQSCNYQRDRCGGRSFLRVLGARLLSACGTSARSCDVQWYDEFSTIFRLLFWCLACAPQLCRGVPDLLDHSNHGTPFFTSKEPEWNAYHLINR